VPISNDDRACILDAEVRLTDVMARNGITKPRVSCKMLKRSPFDRYTLQKVVKVKRSRNTVERFGCRSEGIRWLDAGFERGFERLITLVLSSHSIQREVSGFRIKIQ